MNPLGDRVRAERLRLRMSVRTAATAGGISNTWWGRFEDGLQPLTDSISVAVARALDWPTEWATQPADDPLAALRSLVADLSERFDRLQAQVDAGLGAVADSMTSQSEHPARRTTGEPQ